MEQEIIIYSTSQETINNDKIIAKLYPLIKGGTTTSRKMINDEICSRMVEIYKLFNEKKSN
jgi:hypothetical protein